MLRRSYLLLLAKILASSNRIGKGNKMDDMDIDLLHSVIFEF